MAVGAVLVPLVTILVGAAAVNVEGDAGCPRAAEVAAVLERLTAPAAPGAAADVAIVSGGAQGQAVISLRSAASGEISRRELPADLSCAERATAAAVIIAAWEARLTGPGPGGLLVPLASDRAAAPMTLTAPAATPAPPPLRVALSGGGFVSLNAAGVAAATLLEVGLSRRGSRYGVASGLLFVDAHSAPLGLGDAQWRRYGVTADLRRRLAWSWVWLDARAGAALTVLRLEGRSFSPNQDSTTVDPGMSAGLRVGFPVGALAPWLQIGGNLWPRDQVVTASGGLAASSRLPRAEAMMGIGVAFEPGR